MRYISRRYKAKLSKLYKTAQANDIPLNYLLELKRRCAVVNAFKRKENKRSSQGDRMSA